mmetsp:Transcript_17070/g.22154  ORF Transcript_17070/g.22154 Transcript_17070/m.22154 type:complete len:299 (-) Transcript_17070:540-1436(-)
MDRQETKNKDGIDSIITCNESEQREDDETIHAKHAKQLAEIEAEVKKQNLTSELLPLSTLISYYRSEGSDNFVSGCVYLKEVAGYTNYRRIRGDGNCYFRAFLYSICEACITGAVSSDRIKSLNAKIVQSLDEVCKFGYDRFALEMFHEELVDLFEVIVAPVEKSDVPRKLDEFHERMNEENSTSEYCTWFLRVVTASKLKSDPDRFLMFLDADDNASMMDIPTFCARQVEPMGKECGQCQVLALAEAMDIKVNVEYLDGRKVEKKLMRYEFGPDERDALVEVTLLYRPGHYDILYKA